MGFYADFCGICAAEMIVIWIIILCGGFCGGDDVADGGDGDDDDIRHGVISFETKEKVDTGR